MIPLGIAVNSFILFKEMGYNRGHKTASSDNQDKASLFRSVVDNGDSFCLDRGKVHMLKKQRREMQRYSM
jgi:hypothetical protein